MSQILVEHEQIVFETIKEYLNKNRTFDIKKILPFIASKFAKSSININNEGIYKVITSLIRKKMVIEGTKLTKDNILINPKRIDIFNFIIDNPGKHLNKIAKELEISNAVVYWHLSVILKFGLIQKIDFDNREVYFDINLNKNELFKIYIISKEKSKKIINYLKVNNIGIPKTKLSNDLKIHYNTIGKYLKYLEEFKIISKVKRSNTKLYFLVDN